MMGHGLSNSVFKEVDLEDRSFESAFFYKVEHELWNIFENDDQFTCFFST